MSQGCFCAYLPMQLTPLTGTMTRFGSSSLKRNDDAAYTPHGDDDKRDYSNTTTINDAAYTPHGDDDHQGRRADAGRARDAAYTPHGDDDLPARRCPQIPKGMQLTPLTGTMTVHAAADCVRKGDAAYTPHGDDDPGQQILLLHPAMQLTPLTGTMTAKGGAFAWKAPMQLTPLTGTMTVRVPLVIA